MYLFKLFDSKKGQFLNNELAITPEGKVYNITTKRLMKKSDHIIICHKSAYKTVDGESLYESDVVDFYAEMPNGQQSKVLRGMVNKTRFGFFSLVTDSGEIPEYDPANQFIKMKLIDNALLNPESKVSYNAEELRAKMEEEAREAAEKASKPKIIMPPKNIITN